MFNHKNNYNCRSLKTSDLVKADKLLYTGCQLIDCRVIANCNYYKPIADFGPYVKPMESCRDVTYKHLGKEIIARYQEVGLNQT